MIRTVGPALCAAALVLCACSGGSEEEVIHQSDQGTVTTSGSGDDATTTIDAADGTTVVAGGPHAGDSVAGPIVVAEAEVYEAYEHLEGPSYDDPPSVGTDPEDEP